MKYDPNKFHQTIRVIEEKYLSRGKDRLGAENCNIFRLNLLRQAYMYSPTKFQLTLQM